MVPDFVAPLRSWGFTVTSRSRIRQQNRIPWVVRIEFSGKALTYAFVATVDAVVEFGPCSGITNTPSLFTLALTDATRIDVGGGREGRRRTTAHGTRRETDHPDGHPLDLRRRRGGRVRRLRLGHGRERRDQQGRGDDRRESQKEVDGTDYGCAFLLMSLGSNTHTPIVKTRAWIQSGEKRWLELREAPTPRRLQRVRPRGCRAAPGTDGYGKRLRSGAARTGDSAAAPRGPYLATAGHVRATVSGSGR